ncbi:unnamed protein product [Fusarium graminearum]|nr:unnamed protein product [Fusarium graminearum]CAG1998183.1 unnamed protein product [Fusarium graminearum]
MKTSSASGACRVCGHMNTVHESETCIARGCRKKIKVCGATIHYIPSEAEPNFEGWVVCKPCPDHGRESKIADYSSCCVIDKDADGILYIVQRGV